MATVFAERPVADGVSAVARAWSPEKQRLCELLIGRTFKRGEFQLASGRKSRIYFNLKTTMMHPEGAALCGRLLLDEVRSIGADYIGGLEMGAVPLLSVVSALSIETDKVIPSFFVRKKPKDHGTQLLIEGLDDFAGESLTDCKVLLVDDVATSGGSILQAVDQIKAAGGNVSDAIVILDREEGATEYLATHGITLHALFTATDLGVTDADRLALE